MECNHCKTSIATGEENEHLGQILCEDCYMDALSPVRTCDPWAIHSAKTFEKSQMSEHGILNNLQQRIIGILKETGGIERHELLQRMEGDVSDADLNRAFASLRHMEKARAEKRGNKVFLRLW